ncbi:MAG TPA: AcvB/VirJ family lysyl-phosphatidylglycerol hydrolase [Bacteroidales bacterium]
MYKLLSVWCLFFFFAASYAVKVDSSQFGGFGKLKIYYDTDRPSNIVLFISGNDGWNSGVVNMAKAMTSLNTMVVGIDSKRYVAYLQRLNSSCYYPAADFENLSKFIQKKYRLPNYISPVIIGYSSGATLAYGIIAQAPENTFKGAIGLGFCPNIELPKPLCKGAGLESIKRKDNKGYDLQSLHLKSPFIVLLGEKDKSCDFETVKEFVNKTPKCELVLLPKVGHEYSVQKNWMPQFMDSFKNLLSYDEEKKINLKPAATKKDISRPQGLDELPLKVIPAKNPGTTSLIFMISGDGGWTGFDQELARHLSEQSYSVVGLDALQYFWAEKTPEEVAKDVVPVINYYLSEWECKELILAGYSFGADIMPFLANRLSPDLKNKIKLVAMLSPDEWADFEIHISDMLSLSSSEDDHNVLLELKKWKGKTLVVFGTEETPNKFESLPKSQFKQLVIPGGHHYGNNFDALVNGITKTQTN